MTTALAYHVTLESHDQEKAVSFSVLHIVALIWKKGIVLPEVTWWYLETTQDTWEMEVGVVP